MGVFGLASIEGVASGAGFIGPGRAPGMAAGIGAGAEAGAGTGAGVACTADVARVGGAVAAFIGRTGGTSDITTEPGKAATVGSVVGAWVSGPATTFGAGGMTTAGVIVVGFAGTTCATVDGARFDP